MIYVDLPNRHGDFPVRNVSLPEGKTIINHPFGNGLYHLFMVIWGIVFGIFTHIRLFPNDM